MIIAHLFLRKCRNRMYVMCETSASAGVKPLYPTPEQMFEIELPADDKDWVERIKSRVIAERPELEFGEVMRSRKPCKGNPSAFDIVFHVRKARTFLQKIGIGK